jgi:integrase
MRPARSTMHHEIVTLRQVLKTANRHGWIDHVPDLSAPYKASGKISHRAWFSPEEYQTLYRATRARAKNPPHTKWKWECEQLHDYVLFMANTGLRPDEAGRLEFRDVVIVDDDATGERILEIEVRGKRGVGFCKSMPGAVRPFERLRDRERLTQAEGAVAPSARKGVSRGGGSTKAKPKPTDLIFGRTQRELINTILDELGLKFDRDGQRRTAYSLRHTYICMRLMEGADIYQIAKNCRTSVEMIEKFYASHIKNTLDASAINVRKLKPGASRAPGALTTEED